MNNWRLITRAAGFILAGELAIIGGASALTAIVFAVSIAWIVDGAWKQ